MLQHVVAPDDINCESRHLVQRSPRLRGKNWMVQHALKREVSVRFVL
jgi:hypothetical protein